MPTAEVKIVWWACITWPCKSAKLSLSSLLLGGKCYKATILIHLDCLCSVSLPISVFLRTRFMLSSRGQGTVSKRRGLIACVQTKTPTANFWAQIIFWSLPAAPHSDLSACQYKGVFQDLMFDRLHYSTLSEDASEVLVQLLHCSTEKANSAARVVVKHTPRLCNRCASDTLIHSGGAGLMILMDVSLIFF